MNQESLASPDQDGVGTIPNKYLTFLLKGIEYGINISHIVEIVCIQNITQLPDSPPEVRGIINLRGKVIPVIDLRLRFHMEEREYDERTSIIVVSLDNTSIGLICDQVAEVVDIEAEKIDPPPAIATTTEADECVEGIGRCEEGNVVILLNINRVVGREALEELNIP